MGFRFRKTIKILPGVHLNVSKTGISVSVGGAPITFNFGRGRSRVTGSLPGTGMSYQQDLGPTGRRQPRNQSMNQPADQTVDRPPLLTRLWRAIFG